MIISRNRVLRRIYSSAVAQLYTRIRQPKLFDNVSHFCMFIGHGRSGSSLVGALLNAHPNVVMSNELNVLDYLSDKLSRAQLFNLIYYTAQRQGRQGSKGGGSYTYAVPNQWQGKHTTLKIVGDRKAGATAIMLFRQPDLLTILQQVVGLTLKFVSVVRNPFDSLVTSLKKTIRLPGESEQEHLKRLVGNYFERVSAINNVCAELGSNSIHFVYHERLIADPYSSLKELCAFLDIEANKDYFADCASIIQPKASITRNHIHWPPELVEMVISSSADNHWLQHYEFTDY